MFECELNVRTRQIVPMILLKSNVRIVNSPVRKCNQQIALHPGKTAKHYQT